MPELEPLICPQCGGQITEYKPGATFTTCSYCSTKFRVEENKQAPPTVAAEAVEIPEESDPTQTFVKLIGGVMVAIVVVVVGAVVTSKKTTPSPPVYATTNSAKPAPVPVLPKQNAPDTALLRFGSSGAANGQFNGADSITVDKLGRIYVSDDKLRVQQFDDRGQFMKLLQVPAKGRNYERAHSIDKIEVADDGRLYVAVGGVILIYAENWATQPRLVQVAPDYIEDFAVRPDGSILAVSYSDRIETLLFVNRQGGISRRVEGFHTDGLDAAISPMETAVESVRLAVDSGGNIFSIYALGSLGSYSINYNDEDLSIARFTPAAKFVKAFTPITNASALLADVKDRLYISAGDAITIYDRDGNRLGGLTAGQALNAFTVDKAGQIYTIVNDAVAKYPPIQ